MTNTVPDELGAEYAALLMNRRLNEKEIIKRSHAVPEVSLGPMLGRGSRGLRSSLVLRTTRMKDPPSSQA
jgi:hypothetical protein